MWDMNAVHQVDYYEQNENFRINYCHYRKHVPCVLIYKAVENNNNQECQPFICEALPHHVAFDVKLLIDCMVAIKTARK